MVLAALEDNRDHLPVVVEYFVPLGSELSCSASLVIKINVRYKEGTTIASEVGIRTSANVKYYAPQVTLTHEFLIELGGIFQVITEAVDCSTFLPSQYGKATSLR